MTPMSSYDRENFSTLSFYVVLLGHNLDSQAREDMLSLSLPHLTLRYVYTVGMELQALHFAYAPDERAFLSVAAFYKGKSRSKGWLVPEGKCQKTDT